MLVKPKCCDFSIWTITLILCLGGCHDERAALEILDEQNRDIFITERYYGMSLRVRSQEGLTALAGSTDSLDDPCDLTLVNLRLQERESASLCRFPIFSLVISDCTFDSSALAPFAQLPTLKHVFIKRSPFTKDRDTYPNISTLTDELADAFRVADNLTEFELFSCDQFTGKCFSDWETHPGMRKITLDNSGVNDAGIKAIAKTFPALTHATINTVNDVELTLDGCLELARIRGLITPGISGPALPDMKTRREYFSRYRKAYRRIHGEDSILNSDIPYFLRVE